MSGWPSIAEPELLERLGWDDREFEARMLALAARVPSRPYHRALFERAVSYPWNRPQGSFALSPSGVELLGAMEHTERDRTVHSFVSEEGGRLALLAFGSNGSPEALARVSLPTSKPRASAQCLP